MTPPSLKSPEPRIMFSHLKPETAGIQGAAEATIRPTVVSQVIGDALRFASGLGYIDPKMQRPMPAHSDAPWQVEVKTAPTRNTQESPLSHMVDAVLEVQRFMKGILDLQKLDA
ncbi:hypothetical protein Clacol_001509 [Clathrus columnatus]|uniref:Uncharacterized protein n=1 Tax=Clathrus columnatus TaxID=1419009 RepID=A0AAV5A1E5_9AGAM|nr:hypothetical protein Clacol_001509 [Clathrus columnatus]